MLGAGAGAGADRAGAGRGARRGAGAWALRCVVGLCEVRCRRRRRSCPRCVRCLRWAVNFAPGFDYRRRRCRGDGLARRNSTANQRHTDADADRRHSYKRKANHSPAMRHRRHSARCWRHPAAPIFPGHPARVLRSPCASPLPLPASPLPFRRPTASPSPTSRPRRPSLPLVSRAASTGQRVGLLRRAVAAQPNLEPLSPQLWYNLKYIFTTFSSHLVLDIVHFVV